MKKGDRVRLVNLEALKSMSIGDKYGLVGTIELQTRENNWRVKLDPPDEISWYVKTESLELINELRKGGLATLINKPRLESVNMEWAMGKRVTLVTELTKSEEDRMAPRLKGEHAWWIVLCDGSKDSSKYYVPVSCLFPCENHDTISETLNPPSPLPQEWSYKTETENKKESNSMYVYKVRMHQVPSNLAQQAGEKETIVVPTTEKLADNEYAAVALVAIDNADIIKAVQESKGSLRVHCSNAG